MEQSIARSASTHSGRKDKKRDQRDRDDVHEEIQKVESLGGRGKRATPRKTPKAEGRGGAKFERIEQVDAEIARLKQPPRTLLKEDFSHEYPKLSSDGINPHKFRKGHVAPALLKELFGEPYGDGGRQGYGWAGCKDSGVVTRIQYLHPILYQHPLGETPPYLKIRFAEGVALEYEKGKGHVDWCSFGADTNKTQRERYERDVQKLMALRKTLEGDKPLEVHGKEWRSIKVEPGVGGEERRTKLGLVKLGTVVVHSTLGWVRGFVLKVTQKMRAEVDVELKVHFSISIVLVFPMLPF